MKAEINGIKLEGTPEEISEVLKKSEIKNINTVYITEVKTVPVWNSTPSM